MVAGSSAVPSPTTSPGKDTPSSPWNAMRSLSSHRSHGPEPEVYVLKGIISGQGTTLPRSPRRWPTLAGKLEAVLQYRKCRHLLLAENEVKAEHLQSFVQHQHEMGFTDVSFWIEMRSSASCLDRVCRSPLAASARLPVRPIHGSLHVPSPVPPNGREPPTVSRAQTLRGLVQAEQIVLGADAWSRELASSVGLQMPLRMRVLQALLSTPATPGVLVSC